MIPIARTAMRSLAPLALMAALFWLSAQSDLDTGLGTWDLVLRKLGHAVVFGGLTVLWCWALRPVRRNPVWIAGGISLGYAIIDEYHQSLVEGRSGTAIDVGIDAVGIVIASLILRYDHRVRSVLERFGGAPERGVAMSGDRRPADGARRRPRGAGEPLRGRGDRLR
jgi:VanZ family protein